MFPHNCGQLGVDKENQRKIKLRSKLQTAIKGETKKIWKNKKNKRKTRRTRGTVYFHDLDHVCLFSNDGCFMNRMKQHHA